MERYFIFEEQELVRIGVVCPDCNTEAVFDLTKDQTAIRSRSCPGCEKEILPVIPPNTVPYNAVTAYKRLLDWKEKKVKLIFYFKKP